MKIYVQNNIEIDQLKVEFGEKYMQLFSLNCPLELQEKAKKWVAESGLEFVKVRLWKGIWQCSDPELSEILEKYYSSSEK